MKEKKTLNVRKQITSYPAKEAAKNENYILRTSRKELENSQ